MNIIVEFTPRQVNKTRSFQGGRRLRTEPSPEEADHGIQRDPPQQAVDPQDHDVECQGAGQQPDGPQQKWVIGVDEPDLINLGSIDF
ncbi:MAG: hypothetical protein KGY46_10390 [Anaerolineales bacterium]|nr:hypothetical protein [Anaerolineales bacterium]